MRQIQQGYGFDSHACPTPVEPMILTFFIFPKVLIGPFNAAVPALNLAFKLQAAGFSRLARIHIILHVQCNTMHALAVNMDHYAADSGSWVRLLCLSYRYFDECLTFFMFLGFNRFF